MRRSRVEDAAFRLDESFVGKYKNTPPPWGFGALSEITYLRTYSRIKEDGTNEQWWETIRRVVEGTYRIQERHIKGQQLGWNEARAQRSAREMYDRMFNMKFLPPGRGLWAMGSSITEEKQLFAALNNCAMVSTDCSDAIKPYCFLMDMSMLGVGVGFDTKGAGSITIQTPGTTMYWLSDLGIRVPVRHDGWRSIYPDLPEYESTTAWNGLPVTFNYNPVDGVFFIPDTREGWVISLFHILQGYFYGYSIPQMNYDQVRPENIFIKGFGGVSSGPVPLMQMHRAICEFLDRYIGHALNAEIITTLMNLIGVCVVSGNVRRTAEIVFGDPNDENYLNLKNYRWNPATNDYEGPRADRAGYGWTSNNSVFADIGMDYTRCAELTAINGEPGYEWLDNARKYGRMADPVNNLDRRVVGANPCVEQSLESFELCCLVENFIFRCDTEADFLRTLKYAYLYAKTVSLGKTHWAETNKVMLRNRRIGCSMSGVQQFVATYGLDTLRQFCEKGYQTVCEWDRVYSEWFCVNQSIKKTSIKPSGTVSLLVGATPGMHWPVDLYCIRRIRLAKNSDLVGMLRQAGYPLEPCVGSEDTTVVVEIPLKMAMPNLRPVAQVSVWEQVAMAALLQRYWADNQVSCTVTFDPVTEGSQIRHVLDQFQYHLKGISFLPRLADGAYAQMPYESISEERYKELSATLRPLTPLTLRNEIAELDRFCDGESCIIAP